MTTNFKPSPNDKADSQDNDSASSDHPTTQNFHSKAKKEASQIRKLSTLVDVARRLTACRTTSEVINQILHSALEAIETADAGIFYLYDEESGLLKVQTAIGFSNDAVYNLEMQPGESMSGKAFATGQAALYGSVEEIWASMVSQSPTNLEHMSEATGGKTYPKSAIATPLKLQEKAIGSIVLDNFEWPNAFEISDLNMLQSLADQAAIAIDNVRLYEHQTRLYAQQTQLVQRLEQALRIHDNLTNAVLLGHGVDGIVSALSALLENRVIIFDKSGDIQAVSPPGQLVGPVQEAFQIWLSKQTLYSTSTWFSTAPVSPAQFPDFFGPPPKRSSNGLSKTGFDTFSKSPFAGLPKNVRAVETIDLTIFETASFEAPSNEGPGKSRTIEVMLSPINVGGDLLGWIVVIPEAKPLGELDSVALEHAATVFGLEFMKQQALFEIEVRWKGDLIEDLLSGKPSADFDRRAKALGLDVNEPFICLCIDIDEFANYIEARQMSEAEVQMLKEGIYQTLNSVLKSTVTGSLISQKSDEFIVFVTCPSTEPKSVRQLAKQIAETFQARIKRKHPTLSLSTAVSGVGKGRSSMEVALNETQRLLEHYQRVKYRNGIYFASELGVDRFLLQLPDNKELLDWATTTLSPVLVYDQHNQTELVHTLAAYCANNRNIAETALALHTHQNTVRYRLERVNELLGEILEQSESWFNIEVALRVLRLYGKGG